MTSSIGQNIDALCNEHGLDRELVISAMKEAVKAAARKQFKASDKTDQSIEVDWNSEDGSVEISAHKTVVEVVENPATEIALTEAVDMTGDDLIEIGDELLIPLPTEELGRIAAQTAKQILVQKVREAVREKVYDEYIDRRGELINGTVKRMERGDLVIDLGGNLEALLPKPHQVRSEMWNQGERIRVVIDDVIKDQKDQKDLKDQPMQREPQREQRSPKGQKGYQILVSRTSPELLKRLFEMEVPEIYDDTVVIKSAVREPGERAKIAVSSNEKDVDPVGACVGMKGSRVQSIIKELRGEKIDIIEWSDEPSVFAANALSPAKVSQVRITDINNRKMEVIVTEDQLSLAIGKRGQNVRLATRLVGWDIDIISEEKIKAEITKQMGKLIASGEAVPVTALEGVTNAQADVLREKGIDDIQKLAAASVDELVDSLDVSLDEAEGIIASAKAIVEASAGDEVEAEGQPAVEGAPEAPETAAESELAETETVEVESAEAPSDSPETGSDDSAASEESAPVEGTEEAAGDEV